MTVRKIPYYEDYLSVAFSERLKTQSRPIAGVARLTHVGETAGLETPEALQFLCELYDLISGELNTVLSQRILDRQFIDQRTRACFELNEKLKIDFLDSRYETIIGQEDAYGRVVIGPHNEFYKKRGYGNPIAPLPEFLRGNHVTLFGPPDDEKLSINAMNCFHRKLKGEPAMISELLATTMNRPMWGADHEDSKTPLRADLISAGINLAACIDHSLEYTDPVTQKFYRIESENAALPLKRFPGLALPCPFLFYREQPLPLHLYELALHLFKHWQNESALTFYVPKLENEEEARYIQKMVEHAEKLIRVRHPAYKIGSVRLFIVLENPRAIFRVNEIIDQLYPYFAGASLGWHDYLASTARLFKEDAHYRIPVKADPNIVIKYIKASHDLLAEVVGSRGGIKIGGMYGVLPLSGNQKGDHQRSDQTNKPDRNRTSASFQVAIKGFIKDVTTQLKRDLSGFWVAHPDFVRIGLALVEAWRLHTQKNSAPLETLVKELLDVQYHQEVLDFIAAPDTVGLNTEAPLYARSLIVADIKESTSPPAIVGGPPSAIATSPNDGVIRNHDPEEIRYNVFQSLQYLADWLSGNGCVALPAYVEGVPVRVMDDLATAERSRWEVWHEIHHGRFSVDAFLRIAHEEFHFIRKDASNHTKTVQVKWTNRTAKWYPVALNIMIRLMTTQEPVEFATELLLPFTADFIRNAEDPWREMLQIDAQKYSTSPYIERFHTYFSICGCEAFAHRLAQDPVLDLSKAEQNIKSFTVAEIIEAASFHGDIGEDKKSLDQRASEEQALVLRENAKTKADLLAAGRVYLERFGFKYLISAQGKTAPEILDNLTLRLKNTQAQEIENARSALWQISLKRLESTASLHLYKKLDSLLKKHKVNSAAMSITNPEAKAPQALNLNTTANTWYEIASLSKTVASCFALEYFKEKGISLNTGVNALFEKAGSLFRLQSLDEAHPEWADQVTLTHLMKHSALNMHYVNGIPADLEMPPVEDLINGHETYRYPKVGVVFKPGTGFQYSGGGFLVLELLLKTLEKKSVQELTKPFLDALGLTGLSFDHKAQGDRVYAKGYLASGALVEGSRKMFPAFAAGVSGTAADVSQFLMHLTRAYHSLDGSGPICHDTAVQMLSCRDRASQAFMGVNIGLGVFTAEAGSNRLAIHQGANDGFRCLFVHCYDGPDTGYGFVILCNADTNGVLFIAEAAQLILEDFQLHGINTKRFQNLFDTTGITDEELVNRGYKSLVFGAFEEDLPEAITEQNLPGALPQIPGGPTRSSVSRVPDPLSAHNLAVGATILDVTNQRFARAENLLSAFLPTFNPDLYGKQGKIMDSWESARHNHHPEDDPCDQMIFRLKRPSAICYASVSTQFHNGNHPEALMLQGQAENSNEWITILPKTALEGHSQKNIKLAKSNVIFSIINVSMYPDGGLSRLGLYREDVPHPEAFLPADQAPAIQFTSPIPMTKKPLTPQYRVTSAIVQENWQRLATGAPRIEALEGIEVDVASLAYGGTIVGASNEHYGPAIQVISPYRALNMFDGFESARSRKKGHFEELVIALGRPAELHRIEVDFSYFRNNNPFEISIEGHCAGHPLVLQGQPLVWIPLVEKRNVKAYAGNAIAFLISPNRGKMTHIRVTIYPDGGINRLRAFTWASTILDHTYDHTARH